MTVPSFATVVKEWRDAVYSPYRWVPAQNSKIQAGEAGGFEVEAEGAAFRGYLKPTKICEENHPRAAHEKIASDLAFELGVCVPPVVLYQREDVPTNPDRSPAQERCACVSLILFKEKWEWQEVLNFSAMSPLMRAIISSKMAQCSGAVVLDLLLGQTDRNNARNVVFGTDPAEPESGRFLFLDFANTMNMGDQWANGKWKEIKDPGFPEVMTKSVSKAVLKETVDKMRALHPETIEQIISRIEHPFLSERYKGILMDAIKGRQGLVVDYVNTRYLGGGG